MYENYMEYYQKKNSLLGSMPKVFLITCGKDNAEKLYLIAIIIFPSSQLGLETQNG